MRPVTPTCTGIWAGRATASEGAPAAATQQARLIEARGEAWSCEWRGSTILAMRTAAILAVSILSSLCACARDDVPADDRGSEDQTGDAEETSETSEDCPPGTLDCSCDIGSTCDGDLSCVAGTCQSDSCGDGIVDAGEECVLPP